MAGSGRRQLRVAGGRSHQVKVRLNDEQLQIVEARAAVAGLGLPAYLAQVGAGENESVGGADLSWRRGMALELGAVLRHLRVANNNLNQLARWVNVHEGELPDGVARVLAQVEKAVAAVTSTAGRLDPDAVRRFRLRGSRP